MKICRLLWRYGAGASKSDRHLLHIIKLDIIAGKPGYVVTPNIKLCAFGADPVLLDKRTNLICDGIRFDVNVHSNLLSIQG